MSLRRVTNHLNVAGSIALKVSLRAQGQAAGAGSHGMGPDRENATMSTNPGQFEKSFERVVGTIQERHPFQVIKGNPYDVQFGEMGFLSKQEKAKEMAEGKETEGGREKLRNRLTGEAPLTPESVGADPMQKLARERVRQKLDPRILKESKEAPEFYYENQSSFAMYIDLFKSSGLFVLSLFVGWLMFYWWWRNDTSNVADEPVDYYVSSYKSKKVEHPEIQVDKN